MKMEGEVLGREKGGPLVINEFEGSTKVTEWNKLLEKKCSRKFDKGIRHDAKIAMEERFLWKMSEVAAKKGNRPRINPEMVLQARTMLKRDECGGADGAVVEMVMALPWIMIMKVASLFDAALEKSEGLD